VADLEIKKEGVYREDLCVKSVLKEDQMGTPEKTIVRPGSWVKRAGFRKNGPPVSKSNEDMAEPQIFSRFAPLLDSPRDFAMINHVRAAPPEIKVV
jgi:hypothetical protein